MQFQVSQKVCGCRREVRRTCRGNPWRYFCLITNITRATVLWRHSWHYGRVLTPSDGKSIIAEIKAVIATVWVRKIFRPDLSAFSKIHATKSKSPTHIVTCRSLLKSDIPDLYSQDERDGFGIIQDYYKFWKRKSRMRERQHCEILNII